MRKLDEFRDYYENEGDKKEPAWQEPLEWISIGMFLMALIIVVLY